MNSGEGCHPYDVYMKIVRELDLMVDYMIFEILHKDGNFQPAVQILAKTIVNLKGIMKLCSMNNFSRGWPLSKLLWIGLKQLRMMNPDFEEDFIPLKDCEEYEEEECWGERDEMDIQFGDERYDSFRREKIMNDLAQKMEMGKELNLDFIYAHGYSFDSSIKSPYMEMNRNSMERLIESIDVNTYENEGDLLHEACLLACLIMNETMNKSSLEWKWIMFDYLKGQYDFLERRIDKVPIGFEEVKKQCGKDASKKA